MLAVSLSAEVASGRSASTLPPGNRRLGSPSGVASQLLFPLCRPRVSAAAVGSSGFPRWPRYCLRHRYPHRGIRHVITGLPDDRTTIITEDTLWPRARVIKESHLECSSDGARTGCLWLAGMGSLDKERVRFAQG